MSVASFQSSSSMRSMSVATAHKNITQCVADARSDAHDVQGKALKDLVAITQVSPLYRNLLAQVDGSIPILIALSKSSSSTVQSLSLSILFNLSLNNDMKKLLASMETIYHLNTLISLGSPETVKLASSLICSLAMLDKNKAKFGVAGTIQLLVRALTVPSVPAAHHLLCSLAELGQFHGNCTVAVRSGAISVLVDVVESTSGEDLAGTALVVLGLLARFEEGLRALIKIDRIVYSMVNVLKGRCMLSKEGATEILLRLFDESEGCLRDALRFPEFLGVVADLSVRGSTKARERATLLMNKITNNDLETYSNADSVYSPWY
ncbi:U-box domain-containing protein 1-like [Cucurbita pepo subsp. pepo]|uniref:U-box domain-containing protein 1-like n=1 Tax=Cucurbita pepo subsp. pepo TaxID=3664 RepID=UPI000C9D446C|nr:U-box domain-containing protein 1-like [Cucurbita pepo subsp. pepo]XP_023524301.1 U-box domain-containing protein 1-like [Cucurbita pepo subsp. pepo]XP_023524302.1 U-box domain-containing protein 1-like [Cucurbita pepo subsp. pepo]XP_023524303.1 U-box domain-containing protein 1-like [Cucurbita pepo subsp. pepo]